tara:strand:+ start:158 stop:379 length:222 start_codon:yes stop_codon:yes gene_type:complete
VRVRDGHVNDYAELAQLGQVSRARMTQIMNLLKLAPEIQETILFLPWVKYLMTLSRHRFACTINDLSAEIEST